MQLTRARINRGIKSHVTRFKTKAYRKTHSEFLGGATKVIAMSLYGDDERYFNNIDHVIASYLEFLPDYTCRFYLARDLKTEVRQRLLDLNCEVIIMNASGRDNSYKFWRFLATEDLRIDRALVRDTDSLGSQLEASLVTEWERSGKDFHIIRSHYSHNSRIMAGMWGARPRLKLITKDFVRLKNLRNSWSRDQQYLSKYTYPTMTGSVLIHDIYRRFPDEDVILTPIDTVNFSFIGEIRAPMEINAEWRAEFKRLHFLYMETQSKTSNG